MTRTAPFSRRFAAALTAAVFLASQIVVSPQTEAALGSSTASAGSAPPPAITAIQSFQPDLFTGRATTAVPIAVPPGRKGMQPSLALVYSSSARNGWLGVGWSLDAGYIERSTKNGVPRYDASDTFTFMFQGVASDLVKIPDGTYRAKDEGLFLRFEDKGISGWEVRDKSGTRYVFGQTVASQIESSGKTFRWALDQVIDINGNSLTITYAKDQRQLYLSQIRYTGHAPTGLAPANQVDFILEDRPDQELSFRSGFDVRTAKRLKTIEAKATVGGGLMLARRYTFAYTVSTRTGRSLLRNITQIGADGATSLPATTFAYQDAGATSYNVSANNPTSSTIAWNVRKANWDRGHETYGCEQPYAGAPWSSPSVVSSSVDLGCVNASVSSDGRITMSGCNDHYGHAYTYVYVSSARTISVPLAQSSDSEACVWREDSTGLQRASGNSVSLQAGWSLLHVVSYHQHQGWGPVWLNASLTGQVDLISPSQFLKPQLAGDADGNGITDLIRFNATAGEWTVSCSHGCAFASGSTWLSGFGSTSSTPLLGDWNADGRTDIAIYNGGSWQFATSTGTGFQTGTMPSVSFSGGTPFTGDVNGDGRVDLGTYSGGTWRIAIGNGTGFAPSGTWDLSWGSGTPLTGDFNGDGLTDIADVQRSTGTVTVRLSTGNGWAAPTTWVTGFGTGADVTSGDFNGDGLTDAASYDTGSGQVRYAPSTGGTFGAAVTLPVSFTQRAADDGLQLGDFNGDGLADPAIVNAVTGNAQLGNSTGAMPDLLTTVDNGIGGATAIQYQASTQCDNICPVAHVPVLPFILPLAKQVTMSDGLGHSYTTAYSYAKGRYDPVAREFLGFATVDVRDADGNTTTTTFLQDAYTKGRPSRTEFHDASGALWNRTDHTWSDLELFPGVHFTKLDRTDAYTYDGDATSRHTASRFEYDAYGNVTKAIEEGDAEAAGDERTTVTSYTLNTSAWILNRPSLTQTLDTAGTVVAQRRFAYDGAADGTTLPTKGNLTKEEEWLNLPSAQWFATSLAYDAYGNVTSVTDALTRTTTNTYDTTWTYLTKITNALGHNRQLVYDARTGQVTSTTDQNGVTSATEYDALGRVTKVIGPNDTSALPMIAYTYDLSTVPTKTTVQTRIQSNQSATLTAYSFTDGLGRTIQTRAPAEDATKQVVGGAVEWNARGLVVKQWVPYLEDVSSSYVSVSSPASRPAPLAPPAQYTYDPLGRTLTVTDPDGSVNSTSYDDWSVTATDANGHRTRRTNDGYGRLATVEEFNGPEIYTTTYTYDALNNLTGVTDQLANRTTIQYDSLGRKIAMDDPDMRHWTYAYDAVDNLTSQTDARGVAITFTYDALNRLTKKTYSNQQSAVSYQYDNANKPYSKGKLTEITDGSGSSSFEYDNLGRLTKESKTIDGTTSLIQRAYDLLGRLTSLTYPDNDVATYTYNAQGGIETVSLKPAAASLQPIVTNIDYNAAGQLTKITYGNGVTTDYTYNPQTLRLSSLRTMNNELRTLQDFTYQFDPVGNVTEIQDGVHTGSQTFAYDALNRLTKAVGAYGTKTYAYDPIGNMVEKEGVTMRYGENGAGPHAVTTAISSQQSAISMAYDANGNMLEKKPTASSLEPTAQSFSYDAENRLVEVKTAQDTTVPVTFKPGWNFFSLPVIPEDARISTLFPNFSADFEQLARVSRLPSPAPAFEHYVGIPKFDDFTQLEYGVGYQVYVKGTSDVTVTFTGKLPSQALSKNLPAGWHLLPAISNQQSAISQIVGGLDYDQLLTYDTASQSLKPATTVEAGRAYYVHLRTAGTFRPSLPRDPTTKVVYDGDGGRVKQTTAAGTTTYLGEVLEKVPDGTTTKYVYAGSLRLAAIAVPTGQPANRATRFYHGDHLGSSNVITDATGAVVETTEFSPYGSVVAQSPQPRAPNAFGFTGQRQDSTTGLILFPARAYDPTLGRFLQADPFVQDPSDPQTLNRYSYVRNNPVNFVDPTGHSFWKVFKRVYLALVTFGMSETIPATTNAIVKLSDKAGIDPRYPLALYSAITGAFTGGIGWGVGAAVSGALTSGATSLAMDTGTGRHITQKVAKEFFMDVVGMSPQAAYTAASITVSTGVSIAISLGAQTVQAAYKKFVGYDVTWEKGGAARAKLPFDPPRPQDNNIGVASRNFNPNSPWDQLVKEGGIMSKTVNRVAGMNAFAGLHDQIMRSVGMASGRVSQLTVSVLNFPTMPPAAAVTYGALIAPNSVAAGGITATNAGLSSYGVSSIREEGGTDEGY